MFHLYTDGGSRGNPGQSAIAAVLLTEKGELVDYDARYNGVTTNNQAEYNALLLGLKLAQKNNIQKISVFMDSELVVKQLKGEYRIKDANLQDIKSKVDIIKASFMEFDINHVPREKNKFADKLVNLILDSKMS